MKSPIGSTLGVWRIRQGLEVKASPNAKDGCSSQEQRATSAVDSFQSCWTPASTFESSRAVQNASATSHGPTASIITAGDASSADDVTEALEDIEIAYYLLHSLVKGKGFEDVESSMAQTFADAARAQGVARIVYLGGLATTVGVRRRRT